MRSDSKALAGLWRHGLKSKFDAEDTSIMQKCWCQAAFFECFHGIGRCYQMTLRDIQIVCRGSTSLQLFYIFCIAVADTDFFTQPFVPWATEWIAKFLKFVQHKSCVEPTTKVKTWCEKFGTVQPHDLLCLLKKNKCIFQTCYWKVILPLVCRVSLFNQMLFYELIQLFPTQLTHSFGCISAWWIFKRAW